MSTVKLPLLVPPTAAAAAAPRSSLTSSAHPPTHSSPNNNVLRHQTHFNTTDPTTHSVVVAYDTCFVDPLMDKHFSAVERQRYQEEAVGLYRLQLQALERAEVEEKEHLERQDMETDAFCFFEAFIDWQIEVRERLMGTKTMERALRRLQERLDDRSEALTVMTQNDEAEMRANGRKAWQEEVEEMERQNRVQEERKAAQRAEENVRRRAVLFVVSEEREYRAGVEAGWQSEWDGMMKLQADFAKECEARALEAFLNSPEQLALAAERAKKERRQRLREKKAAKKFETEQKKMIQGCTHGPQGSSVFQGKKPRTMCPRCRIQWDEELGHYVAMDPMKRGSVTSQQRRSVNSASMPSMRSRGKENNSTSKSFSEGHSSGGKKGASAGAAGEPPSVSLQPDTRSASPLRSPGGGHHSRSSTSTMLPAAAGARGVPLNGKTDAGIFSSPIPPVAKKKK